MTSMRCLALGVAGGCALALGGCGSGDSGSGTGTGSAPVVSTLSTSRSAILQSSGVLDVTVGFTDPDGDLASIRVGVRDAGGTLLHEDTSAIQGAAGHTSGSLTGTLDFTGAPVGTFTLEFTLLDAKGNASVPARAPLRILPAFGPSANLAAPEASLFLGATAIGDLDGDRWNDVAAIQGSNVTGKVALYRHSATGAFGAGAVLQADLLPGGVAVADVTGDGRADLVLSGVSTTALSGHLGRVVVYPQQADGSLGAPVEYVLSDDGGGPLQVVDVDGDGRTDVVTVSGGRVHLLFQDGSGALGGEVAYGDPSGATPFGAYGEVHVADMDGDGVPDLVFQSGPLELSVALQTTPRGFGPPTSWTVPTSSWGAFDSFALGDLDGDGRADVVTVEGGNYGYINVFLQRPGGTLALQPPMDLWGDVAAGVEVADLDGDGLQDIAVDAATTVYVLYQAPDHHFLPAAPYHMITRTSGGQFEHRALSIGDVTGDGKADLVTTWSDEGLFVLARW